MSSFAPVSYVTSLFSNGPVNGFSCPMGMTFDSNSNLFVCDGGNSQIVKVDTQGNASIVQLTNGAPNDSSSLPLCFPEMVVFDSKGGRYNGYMYVMDGNNTIYKVKCNSGVYTPFANIIGHYLGMAIDSHNNLYYSSLDYPSATAKNVVQRIFKITPDGSSNLFLDLTDVVCYPGGLAADKHYLYVADLGGNTIGRYPLTPGKLHANPSFITLTPSNNPTLNIHETMAANFVDPSFNPYGGNQCNITLAPNGDLIVLTGNDGQGNNTTIDRYDATGKLVATISSAAMSDLVNGPIGVAVDSKNNVYISNQNINTVCVITHTA